MVLCDKGLFVVWFGLAVMLVIPANALERTRRILNEPGDATKPGKTSLPFLKRQQIIYLLNNNHNDKRTKQTGKPMETYAKELTPDGKVVKPHATKFLNSEDFHGGGVQEIAVNKGDGPPIFDKQSNAAIEPLENRKQPAPQISAKIATITKIEPIPTTNKVTTNSEAMNDNLKDTAKNIKRTQTDVNANKKSDYPNSEDSGSVRVKNSMIRPYRMFRNPDGELVMPTPKQIDPNLYEIGQSEVHHIPRRYRPMRYDDGGGPFPGRRWRGPGRWRPRPRYYSRRRHRPRVFYAPIYRGNPDPPILSYASTPLQPEDGSVIQPGAAYRNQVMLQPVSLPMVSAPQQPTLQNPLIQQADARSVLYNVPMATTAAQVQQPVVYPIVAFQQPQQFVQLQPGVQPAQRLLASHWSDEQGHTRSEEPPRPPPDYDDDDRHDDDDDDDRYRYESRYNNEPQFHSDRDDEEIEPEQFARDRWEDYPRPRPYYEENPDARSEPPDQPAALLPPPPRSAPDDNTEDDDDDENEIEAYQHDLQDSKDEPLLADGPPVIEREEPLPENYEQLNAQRRDGSRPIIPISSSLIRPHQRFMYPNTMSTDTFAREQLAGSPFRQGALPGFRGLSLQRANLVSPSAEMSEMSADEARFRERMRLELQAKDTIPRGLKTKDGLKNVFIRLNGEPLENASELRSRIVHGRVIPGRGKIIRSKGPMKIRVSHRGAGKHRIKIIDIFSPKKFNVVDSRSKIIKAPLIKQTSPNGQKHVRVSPALNSNIKGSKTNAKSVLKNAILRNYNKQGTRAKFGNRTVINKINVIKVGHNQKPS